MSELLTARLCLRLLDARDADLYRALYTSPRVMAHIGAPLTDTGAARAFAAAVEHNALDAPGHRSFTVLDRATAAAVGLGALLRDGARAEIGLMLLPSAWDGRRSHEVLDALVAHAFDAMVLDVLVATCLAGPNVRPSRRLVEPYGFAEAAPLRVGTVRWELPRTRWVACGRAMVGSVDPGA
jgi:RimJ/RimL family protein N-acetyltransferase